MPVSHNLSRKTPVRNPQRFRGVASVQNSQYGVRRCMLSVSAEGVVKLILFRIRKEEVELHSLR
jgi:hypothetical protein